MGIQKSLQGVEHEERQKICPECGGEIGFRHGEDFCKKCGLILND
ncbi:MAG: hypothetical protein ABIH34_01825 [Nanoarchaeota archaeon]